MALIKSSAQVFGEIQSDQIVVYKEGYTEFDDEVISEGIFGKNISEILTHVQTYFNVDDQIPIKFKDKWTEVDEAYFKVPRIWILDGKKKIRIWERNSWTNFQFFNETYYSEFRQALLDLIGDHALLF